jgi:toxin ParE1/3/4
VRLKVVRRPAAAEDLREIWWYSFENWGMAQADQYAADIERAIHRLAERDGRRLAQILKGTDFFRMKVNSHNLFFKVDEQHVTLTRVLHSATDEPRHLR